MLKHIVGLPCRAHLGTKHTILSPRTQNCGFWFFATIDFVTYARCLLLCVVLNFVYCETKILKFHILKIKLF
jgi:hypothetical protein